jgi:dephospho-CoA kinase
MRARREPLAVLDVPLLFETGGESRCDAVAVVSAPAVLQRQRVLRRPGMTPQRFAEVLAQQMPDAEKRRRADFVISTGQGRGVTLRALSRMVRLLRGGHRRDRNVRGERHA